MPVNNTDLNDLLIKATKVKSDKPKLTRWQRFKFHCRLRWHLLMNGVI